MAALIGYSWCLFARSFPRGIDFARLDHVAGLVAPAVALVSDDGGEVGVRELFAEPRHGRALFPVQHDLDVPSPWAVDELGAVERWEGSLDPLPVRLMAGDAVRRVDLLAARLQVGEIPFPVRIVGRGGGLHFLLCDPGAVLCGRDHFDYDRHETVVLAAE